MKSTDKDIEILSETNSVDNKNSNLNKDSVMLMFIVMGAMLFIMVMFGIYFLF
ncbi:MAG: hypothetical protein IJ097_03545 [Bacilli bacterium]|nr:hypothetical protein [Bacilli bacterium]